MNCSIYPPAHFDRHKHYPLVIGERVWDEWDGLGQGVATCGAWVVLVARPSWWDGIEQWEENVRGVYGILAREPCIDTRKVYLFAASAETKYLNECLVRSPGLWAGAILFTPEILPDFSQSSPFQIRPKILASAGGEEHREDFLKKYQSDALQSGALVEIVIHPGEYHALAGNVAQGERLKSILHFIFEE